MAEKRGKLQEVRLTTPVSAEAIAGLELGQVVYLDGVIYTGREGVYRRILDEGVAPPVDLKSLSNVNFHCSPAASVAEDGGYNVGAVTATASFRFSKWMARWFEISGARVVIGKGGMPVSVHCFCLSSRRAVARIHADGSGETRTDPKWFTPYMRRDTVTWPKNAESSRKSG